MIIFYKSLLFVGLLFLFRTFTISGEIISNKDTITTIADSVVVLDDLNISFEELVSQAKWGRNIFLPYYDLSAEKSLSGKSFKDIYTYNLQKIFWKDSLRCALINNYVINQGDYLLDMKVQYVGESIVILLKHDASFVILKQE